MARGRPKGSPNKATLIREATLARLGIMPLDYLLWTLRNENMPHRDRFNAAIAAAPYCHPKLAQVDTRIWTQMTADSGRTLIDPASLSYEEREALRMMMQRQTTLAIAAIDDDTIDGQLVTQAA